MGPSLAEERENINPMLMADQQRHGVDINLNVYTQMSLANRLEAVEIPCARPVARCRLHNIPAMTFRPNDAGQPAPLFQLFTSPEGFPESNRAYLTQSAKRSRGVEMS